MLHDLISNPIIFQIGLPNPLLILSSQASLLAAAVIGSFSWPIPETIHWLGPASWYASLIMSFCAVLLSASEHFLYAASRDTTQNPDLRRRLNMVLSIKGGGPGDLMLSPVPDPPGPAVQPQSQSQQGAQGLTGNSGGQGRSVNAGTPSVRAEVRWNMVFTWQAPMMLLSYSLIGFLMGLTICVLTPLYDGRDFDDACKVYIPPFPSSVFQLPCPPSTRSWLYLPLSLVRAVLRSEVHAEVGACADSDTLHCVLSLCWRYICVVLFLGVYIH